MASYHSTFIKPLILVILLLILTSFSEGHLCLTEQQDALLQFKETYYYPDMISYFGTPSTLSWPNDTDCCTWEGVTCDKITGDVISLDISLIGLAGTINSSSPLFLLQHLESLNVSHNYLSGSLSSFTQLPKLLHLDLSNNHFFTIDNNSSLFLQNLQSLILSDNGLSGSLDFFFQLPKLVHLDLSQNDFNATIPLGIGYSTLKGTTTNSISLSPFQNLQSLNLSNNLLSGSLDFSFFQLPKLLHLDLSHNSFDATIPLDIGYSTLKGSTTNSSPLFPFQNLQSLNLSHNWLSGSLNFLGQFLSLKHLDLSFNAFSGIVPHEIVHLSQLMSLNLGGNNLAITSSILESLMRNLTQIQELNLGDVRMDEVSPSSMLTSSSTLTSLTVSNCSLRGRFLDYVFHLPNLRILDASENLGLIGTLPNLNWSSPLISLDLSSTNFSGNIPNSIANLKNLENLNLHSCHFTNSIPPSICSLSSLQVLDLSGNGFFGMIPQCLGNLTNLHRLDLSLSQLMGPLPQSLINCTLLEFVDVSSGMLTDTFPSWLDRLPNLDVVDLGQNRFYGPIGTFFNRSMFGIILRQNDFSGHLPDFVGNLSVSVLDLSTNSLEGPIPNLPWVQEAIVLSNNKFTGKIPLPLCDYFVLFLDLFNNSLTGTIPPCLLNSNIFTIVLGMNKLEGPIPDIFAESTRISVLDLSRNQIKGPLPRSLVNCTGLFHLDLSNNDIEDSFPNWLETLPDLGILVLASNKLNGNMNTLSTDHPFPKLQIFDVSNNYLTGPIPIEYINQLDGMKKTDILADYTERYIIEDEYSSYEYQSSITLTIKGSRIVFPKILSSWISIDFSNNSFQGEIPQNIGELAALKGLNLSHNNLTGSIPLSIQNLSSLEWLDLSSNKLNGLIPTGLTSLTELASLNLSYNELKGRIPEGRQFDTFGVESFVGNMGLCGSQVEKPCDDSDIPKQPQVPLLPTEEDDFSVFDWKIILTGYGCGLVIGVSIGYIVFELRRPKWFVSLVEEKLLKKIARSSRWRA